MENKSNIALFLKTFGFKTNGNQIYTLDLVIDEEKVTLRIKLLKDEISLIETETGEVMVNFASKEITDTRIKNIYNALTGDELEIIPNVTCTEDMLFQLGCRRVIPGYVLEIPTLNQEVFSMDLLISLSPAKIYLRTHDNNIVKQVLIEKREVTLERIKEIYTGITGLELINE